MENLKLYNGEEEEKKKKSTFSPVIEKVWPFGSPRKCHQSILILLIEGFKTTFA